MPLKQILLVYLVLLAGLVVTAGLISSPFVLAGGPPPTVTPQVIKITGPLPVLQTVQTISQPLKAIQTRLDSTALLSSPAGSPAVQASSGTGWQKIMADGFEGATPPGWLLIDDSGTDGGEYFWGQRNCKPHLGSYSLWAGGGGSDGSQLLCGTTYTNNLKVWLRYGPFDLSQATDAELQFADWVEIEEFGLGTFDEFWWGASLDGANFQGYTENTITTDWVPNNLKLNNVRVLGDLTGKSQVYVAWIFESNELNLTTPKGAFLDDVALWIYLPPPATPPPSPVTLPITRHTTMADFAGGHSYDGTLLKTEQDNGALALAMQANALGNWERLPSLPKRLYDFAAVIAQDHLFVIGGNCPEDDLSPECSVERRVYSAAVGADGRLGQWRETTMLPQRIAGHRAAAANGYLFVVGGWNLSNPQGHKLVYSARIQPDGSLGSWATLSLLPEALVDPAVVAAHGYLYVLGGQRSSNTASDKIYRAAINANGTIGPWLLLPDPLPVTQSTPPLTGLDDFVALAANDYLYILGGNDHAVEWNGVFRAQINADGSLGTWTLSQPLPSSLSWHSGVAARGGLLIAGGFRAAAPSAQLQNIAYWAAIQPDGNLGQWTPQPDLLFRVSNQELVASDTHVYNLGGINPDSFIVFSSVLAAPLQTTMPQVTASHFNHQFELGQDYLIKTLHWQEIGDQGQIQVRYRLASSSQIYGPWSDFTSTQPVAVNAIGRNLEYQFLYLRQGSATNDKIISQVDLDVEPEPFQSTYLPLILKNK